MARVKAGRVWVWIWVGGLLSACSLAPSYDAPSLPVPARFQSTEQTVPAQPTALGLPWQEFFLDDALKLRLREAFQHNRDLKLAALAIQASRAQYAVQDAERYLFVNAEMGGDYLGQRARPTQKNFTAMLSVPAFELDFFGRLKNMSVAALEQYFASEAAEKAGRLILMKQLAEAHYALRFSMERQALARATRENASASHALLLAKLKTGQASAFDLARSQSQIRQLESAVQRREREILQAKNTLSLLMGQFDTLPESQASRPLSEAQFVALPDALGSEVLLGRPDVMEAEHNLRASYANIGVARAAFFPSMSLTGSVGYMSEALSSLVSSSNTAWTFLPKITLPIFNAGRNAGNLELAHIRKEEAILRYEKVIQGAFREVADGLLNTPVFMKEKEAQHAAIEALKNAYALARERLIQGRGTYQDLLNAERDLYDAQMAYLDILEADILNSLNLYLALGGEYRALSHTGILSDESTFTNVK